MRAIIRLRKLCRRINNYDVRCVFGEQVTRRSLHLWSDN
jgi:hypothetical protein